MAVKKYDKSKVSSTKLRAIKREVAIMLYLARKRYGGAQRLEDSLLTKVP